jgi:hypothetical protein
MSVRRGAIYGVHVCLQCMRDKEKAVRFHFTHHSIFSGQSSSIHYLHLRMGRAGLSACVESADMANDCFVFHHVYALIVLMLVCLHQGQMRQPNSSSGAPMHECTGVDGASTRGSHIHTAVITNSNIRNNSSHSTNTEN